MKTIQIVLLVFVLVETLNMLELYFLQDNCKFNGACIFSGWEKSKADPEVHALLRYLVNWLAGVKMIVIGLLLVLIFTAPEQTLLLATIALILTTASYFWRMNPMLHAADKAGQVKPRGHAKRLSMMLIGLELSLVFGVVAQILKI